MPMLIERDNELSYLNNLIPNVNRRRGSIVQIIGEAGIGKTSLISAFIENAPRSVIVSLGMCDALYTPRPLGAVYETALNLGGKCQQAAERRASAEELFPIVLAQLQRTNAPVICVIEDVHWADNGTLDFIRFLGRRISGLPVLLILTFRGNEVSPHHALSPVLGDLPSSNLHRLELAPLTSDGVAQLNQNNAISTKDILKVTGGNPFFVTELLASQHGDLTSVPGSVREAVNARLSRISADERRFLETASLIPVSIQIPHLNPLFGGNAEMLASACIGRGLLKRQRDGSIRFRHELARLATADRLTSIEQRSIHEKLLNVILEIDTPPLDRLVHHAAGALNTKVVLKYAPLAAEEASNVGSHREAAAHLATALEFVSEAKPELAARLYEDWAYVAGLALKIDDEVIDARRHAITLWRALGRKDKVGENLRWLSRLHWYRGESTKAAQYSDDAVRILEAEKASPEQALAFSLRSQMHMLNDRMPEAIKWGEKAINIAETFGREDIKVHALNNIGTAKMFRGDTSGLPLMQESLRLARKLKRHEDVARVYTNLAEYAVEFRDFDLAEKNLSDGIAFDTEHDLDNWTFYLIGRLAQLRLEQGRLQDAATIAEGVLQRDDQTLLMKLPAKIVLAKSKMRLGQSDAQRHLSEALQAALSVGEVQYIIPARTCFVEFGALHGVTADTREHCMALSELAPDQIMRWRRAEIWFWARACHLEVATGLIEDLPEPYMSIFETQPAHAADQFSNIGMSYHSAYALMLSDTDPDILESYKLAREMGAIPLATRCRDRASERGLTRKLSRTPRGPYSASKSHPLGLTRKEQEVLSELATGASNAEIAERLSRSCRTIENHVSAVLQKMNASSRTDVILRIQNEPWLLPNE